MPEWDRYDETGAGPPYESILADMGHTCRECEIMVFPQVENAFIDKDGNVLCHSCAGERFINEQFCTPGIYKELKRLRREMAEGGACHHPGAPRPTPREW